VFVKRIKQGAGGYLGRCQKRKKRESPLGIVFRTPGAEKGRYGRLTRSRKSQDIWGGDEQVAGHCNGGSAFVGLEVRGATVGERGISEGVHKAKELSLEKEKCT